MKPKQNRWSTSHLIAKTEWKPGHKAELQEAINNWIYIEYNVLCRIQPVSMEVALVVLVMHIFEAVPAFCEEK